MENNRDFPAYPDDRFPYHQLFRELRQNGADLLPEDFRTIIGTVTAGATDTLRYFGFPDPDWPKFLLDPVAPQFGYAPGLDILSVPLIRMIELAELLKSGYHLNTLKAKKENFAGYTGIFAVLDLLYGEGCHETIHRLKKQGRNGFLAETVGDFSFYRRISPIGKLLTPTEIEVRTKTDEVLSRNGRPKLSGEFDRALRNIYPDRYNRPPAFQYMYERTRSSKLNV